MGGRSGERAAWVSSLVVCGVRRLALSSGRRCGGSLLSSGVASLAPARAAAAAGGASQALDERCGAEARRARRFERSSGAAAATAFEGPQRSASAVSSQRRLADATSHLLAALFGVSGLGNVRFTPIS